MSKENIKTEDIKTADITDITEKALAQSSKLEDKKRKSGIKYWVKRILTFILVAYIAVITFLYLIQTTLIFPGHQMQGSADAVVKPLADQQLISLTTAQGDHVMALFGGALTKDGKAISEINQCPTMIYFYGNAMCIKDATVEFNNFRRLGINVIVPDFVGYGMSSGQPSENNFYATADAVYDYLMGRNDINKEKIISAGWSIGSAVAIDLASRRKVAGLAAFSGFTSIIDMGKKVYSLLPIPKFIIKHRFESERKIAQVKCPIFIAHGKRDSLIPWEMSERLSKAATAPVTIKYFDNAEHGDIFEIGGNHLLGDLREFLAKV